MINYTSGKAEVLSCGYPKRLLSILHEVYIGLFAYRIHQNTPTYTKHSNIEVSTAPTGFTPPDNNIISFYN